MKTVAIISALCLGSASAFAPAYSGRASVSLRAASLDDMIGATVEVGEKIWDPMDMNRWVPADYAREAELANGRSAMLATVGWLWPATFGTFTSDDVTTTDPIDAILQADPQWWAQFIVLCGVFEFWKYQKKNEGCSYTGGGEPAVDYLNLYPKDPEARKTLEVQELKNARLAMIGIAGLVSNHLLPGSCPVPPGF